MINITNFKTKKIEYKKVGDLRKEFQRKLNGEKKQ